MGNRNSIAKRGISRIFFFLFVVVIACSIQACSKKGDNLEPLSSGGGTKLIVNVLGVADQTPDAGPENKIVMSLKGSGTNPVAVPVQQLSKGVQASVTSTQDRIGARSGSLATTATNAVTATNATGASILVMTTSIKYRILLYRKADGSFFKSILATAGTPLSIDVNQETYLWYAYSYNTSDDISDITNNTAPSIQTPTDKEFLYASGTITPTKAIPNAPLSITFAEKLTQVVVDINTKGLNGQVTNLTASFASSSNFNTGQFDLLKGACTTTTPYTTSSISFTTDASTGDMIAKFYTADPSKLTTFDVNITSLNVTFPNGKAQQLIATGTPKKFTAGTFTPVLGKVLTAQINLWKLISPKIILHVSDGSVYGFAAETGASFNFLQDARNFGTQSTSRIKTQAFNHVNVTTSVNLLNWLNASPKPDVIIIGFSYVFTAADITALTNYVNNKGVLILMTDGVQGGPETHVALLNSILGTTNITRTTVNAAGAVYPFGNQNDDILNGPFGDVRNKWWGEDSSVTSMLSGLPTSQITAYTNGTAINFTSTNTGITMFKHNTLNFFWIGDGGFTANQQANGTFPNNVTQPFATDGNNFPILKMYGAAGNGLVAGATPTYNSILFANWMAWAVKRAEFFGINTPQ